MSRVQITFEYEPEEEARDPDHQMGITEEEFFRVFEVLSEHFPLEEAPEISKASS